MDATENADLPEGIERVSVYKTGRRITESLRSAKRDAALDLGLDTFMEAARAKRCFYNKDPRFPVDERARQTAELLTKVVLDYRRELKGFIKALEEKGLTEE